MLRPGPSPCGRAPADAVPGGARIALSLCGGLITAPAAVRRYSSVKKRGGGAGGDGAGEVHPVHRDGQVGQAGGRLGGGAAGGHGDPGHGLRAAGAPGRGGLPAPDRGLPREHLRGRQDPGRVLQARRAAEREGDPDLAHDRPAAAAALPRGLQQRDPGGGPSPVRGHGERLRHPRHHRRLRGAVPFRHPLRQPDRRRARRLLGRPVRGQPQLDRAPDQEQVEPAGGRYGRGHRDGGVGGGRDLRGGDGPA